jgi:F0F1-type ATP synthase assembly protein I
MLRRGDPEAIAKALELLRTDPSPRGWHILEGQTYPDALIITGDALVVIEGKRTELGPTTGTTWMPVRHQMLRHIDAAWEIRGHRVVYGFFIVEAEEGSVEVPQNWIDASQRTIAPEALAESLPHRSPAERDGITRAFLGVTTWQAVCAVFGISSDELPDELSMSEEVTNEETVPSSSSEVASPRVSRLSRIRTRAQGAVDYVSETGKSGIRSAQEAIQTVADTSSDLASKTVEKTGNISRSTANLAGVVVSDAWSGASTAGKSVIAGVSRAPEALLSRIMKECVVPALLLPQGCGPKDFYCAFDFREAVNKLERGILVRPKIEVWAGRHDVDRHHLAAMLRSRFSEQFSAERARRVQGTQRGFSREVELLKKEKALAGENVEAVGTVFVASLLTMFFVANPIFNLIFLVLAIFAGTAGITKAFKYVKSAALIAGDSAAAKREQKELENVLDAKNSAFSEAVDNLEIHIHPVLRDLTADFCELDDRPPPPEGMARDGVVPTVGAFLRMKRYRADLPRWYGTLADAHAAHG